MRLVGLLLFLDLSQKLSCFRSDICRHQTKYTDLSNSTAPTSNPIPHASNTAAGASNPTTHPPQPPTHDEAITVFFFYVFFGNPCTYNIYIKYI